MPSLAPFRVAVLGASGVTGGELIRLLLEHPSASVSFVGAETSAGRRLAEVHPHLAASPLGDEVLGPMEPAAVAGIADAAFLALPHGASSRLAPPLVEFGLRVIDLSGDFRLPAGSYPDWYGFIHPAPAWLDKAVYGLPELFATRIRDAALVANPGCFPTPVVLGLAPLLRAGAIGEGAIHVDGKTGLSGAGGRVAPAMQHLAAEESVRPYRFPRHQHTPEMEHALALTGAEDVRISFVPHLVPAVRGVLVTCFARLADPDTSSERLTAILDRAYEEAPFVRVLPPGAMVDTKRTRGANLVELQAAADPRTGTAIVVGAIDNLVKGAAGQAVQNLNLMHGLNPGTGLPAVGMYP